MYSGYGITLYYAGFRSFDNDTARNVTIFCVNNCLSSHADNGKKTFFSDGWRSKFLKTFALVSIIMPIIVNWLLMENKCLILKLTKRC